MLAFSSYFIKLFTNDVSCEFDKFRVDTHLCKLRCWYSCSIDYYVSVFFHLMGGITSNTCVWY